jgi:hypothetical protein
VVRKSGDLAGLSERARAEVERMTTFLRLTRATETAGVDRDEAVAAIYPDVYADDDKWQP